MLNMITFFGLIDRFYHEYYFDLLIVKSCFYLADKSNKLLDNNQ